MTRGIRRAAVAVIVACLLAIAVHVWVVGGLPRAAEDGLPTPAEVRR